MRFRYILPVLLLVVSPPAHAGGVFEVIHPDVEQGEIELEFLNSIFPDVDEGERSVHELAIGYGFADFWKTTFAIELANPVGEAFEVEAFEIENLLILFGGHDHEGEEGDVEEAHGLDGVTLGVYGALEIPNEGGLDEGAFAVGPVVGFGVGPVEVIGNLFAEIPFENGVDAGLAYATSAMIGLGDSPFSIGVEAHGEIEEAFGDAPDADEQEHFFGPALGFEAELDKDRKLEARLAFLAGLTEASPDLAVSFNVEFKL